MPYKGLRLVLKIQTQTRDPCVRKPSALRLGHHPLITVLTIVDNVILLHITVCLRLHQINMFHLLFIYILFSSETEMTRANSENDILIQKKKIVMSLVISRVQTNFMTAVALCDSILTYWLHA